MISLKEYAHTDTKFLYNFNVFFRFLAEMRFRTIIKLLQKQVLEPKRAVLVPPAPCLKLQSGAVLCCLAIEAFPENLASIVVARAWVGAQSGLGPGPGWGPYGPIGPLWAHKGPYGPDFN